MLTQLTLKPEWTPGTPAFLRSCWNAKFSDDQINDMIRVYTTLMIRPGMYLCRHWNHDRHYVEKLLSMFHYGRPDVFTFEEHEAAAKALVEAGFSIGVCKVSEEYRHVIEDPDVFVPFPAYGVVDSPEQLMELIDLGTVKIPIAVFLVEVRREHQSPQGGWRHHKWGPYLGTQEPQHEHLYDDKHIERVFTYHIYHVVAEQPAETA